MLILEQTSTHFLKQGQQYLETLYLAVFATAYFGLFRIGELATGQHAIKAVDVQIASNKQKLLFILRTSKTHGLNKKPQMVKISSSSENLGEKHKQERYNTICPYNIIRNFLAVRPTYSSTSEPFFVFADRSPITPAQVNKILKTILKEIGLNQNLYSFHSYRAGRSVDLVSYGISVETVKKLGRWTSNSIYRYLS